MTLQISTSYYYVVYLVRSKSTRTHPNPAVVRKLSGSNHVLSLLSRERHAMLSSYVVFAKMLLRLRGIMAEHNYLLLVLVGTCASVLLNEIPSAGRISDYHFYLTCAGYYPGFLSSSSEGPIGDVHE